MKITDISIGTISIPLITPFKTALRTVDRIQDLIVRVTLDSGETGYGEAPPTAVITGETSQSIAAAIRDYLAPAVLGLDAGNRDELFGRLDALPCVRILRVLAVNPRTAGIRRNHNRDLIPPVNGVFLPGRIEVVLNHYQVSER